MNALQEIKQSAIEKGMIDKQSVEQLNSIIFDNEGINKEKANFLFELKDAFLEKKNHASWSTFFINSITIFLLEDDISPGAIDNDEARWLRAKIQYDGKLDNIEKDLLDNLKRKSINFPEILHFKNKESLFFEAILFRTRYITFLAVIGSLMASIVLFITATKNIIENLLSRDDNHHLLITFVSSIDEYLFATVLLIFGIGIYELFINKIDIVNKQKDSRPNWLKISSIDDLKSSLGKVILMILIVSFFEHSLNINYEGINDLLFLGIGILLISASLFLTHVQIGHKKDEESK